MSKTKDSVVLYESFFEATAELEPVAIAEIWRAIHVYLNGDEPQFTDASARLAWRFIVLQLNADQKKWQQTCEKRTYAGRRGMAARWDQPITNDNKNNKSPDDITKITNVNFVKNEITNITDTDTESDTDKKKEREKMKKALPRPRSLKMIFRLTILFGRHATRVSQSQKTRLENVSTSTRLRALCEAMDDRLRSSLHCCGIGNRRRASSRFEQAEEAEAATASLTHTRFRGRLNGLRGISCTKTRATQRTRTGSSSGLETTAFTSGCATETTNCIGMFTKRGVHRETPKS